MKLNTLDHSSYSARIQTQASRKGLRKEFVCLPKLRSEYLTANVGGVQ